MLRTSDDAAASVLWRSGGSAAIVERTATRLGLTGTRPPADPDILGYTAITATDTARSIGTHPDGTAYTDAAENLSSLTRCLYARAIAARAPS
jgi:hypothetical protein